MPLLKRLFGRRTPTASVLKPFDAAIAPDTAFFAIGDIHGCLTKMRALERLIADKDPTAPVVYVGDYVDRGEDSAGVLRALFEGRDDRQVICLSGNHEEMMLAFIDQPEVKGELWLRYGGMQTLASFGIGGVSPATKGEALIDVAERLHDAIGPEMLNWLRELNLVWKSGNVAVVHAGADPALPINLQGPRTLAWGHPDFDTKPRQDGVWVAHGHTIVDEAVAQNGRISIDTGAYASGPLTAAYIAPGYVEFIQA